MIVPAARRRTRCRAGLASLAITLVATSLVACNATTDDTLPSDGPVRAVDGDTLVIERDGIEERVRIIGINTPESGECLADVARERLAELVADGPIQLVSDTTDTDSFGRLLRYVETAASTNGSGGIDVGAVLVSEGLAIARRYEPDVARADTYERLQHAAREAEVGLWAPDACGTAAVREGAIEVRVNADPPGDDTDALDGEWVEFVNTTSGAIDLSGFTVADESASNRFAFDEAVLEPLGALRLVTGCGTDTDTVVHWCASGSAVWNNDGDTVFLRDPAGNIVVATTYERP